MTVRGFLLALALLASEPVDAAAQCHRYAIWRYPWAQRCAMGQKHAFPRQKHVSEVRGPSGPDIPLPLLTRSDCEGGEADELTRGKLLLRAALEIQP